MTPILYAALVLFGIGALCALILVLASKYMSVPVDERLAAVRECLPGANCGACGYPGCDGYAEALANGSETRTNLCIPGADKVSKDVSEALGVEFANVVEMVAFVKCMGNCNISKEKYTYEGIGSCRAASLLYNGKWECTQGCLGYGDCAAVCPQNAIVIENGLARVETKKCVGCGLCAKACPHGLIDIIPDVERVVVTCSNTERGAVARGKCENACIGCKKCEKVCPDGAIKVIDNCAVVDYTKCTGCGLCTESCPTGCLKKVSFPNLPENFVWH